MVARGRTQEEIDRPPTRHEPREVRTLHARGKIARMPGVPRLDVGLHPITVEVRLDLLKAIASFDLRGISTAYADAEIRQRAKMLPTALVPLARAAVHLESTKAATELVSSRGPSGQLREGIAEELLQVVTATLSPKGSPEDPEPNCRAEISGWRTL